MKIIETLLSGVFVVQGVPETDHRGEFSRIYCGNELAEIMENRRIIQINHSRTHIVGGLRGLHFQYPPHAEMKLVRCIKGRVFDVAVDLREESPTFLKWHAEELTPENHFMIVIPEGCAHGFQTLAVNSELLYLHTACYEKSSEDGVRYDDPMIAITWPEPVTDISDRDKNHPWLNHSFQGIRI